MSEATSLLVGDIDDSGKFQVNGKGNKERVCRIGLKTFQALRRYLRARQVQDDAPLWAGCKGRLTPQGMQMVFKKLTRLTGIHVNPHKFRRTFALMMLRNGCNVYSLQSLMGHSDLTVLRQYLAETEADVVRAHEAYSPVDRL